MTRIVFVGQSGAEAAIVTMSGQMAAPSAMLANERPPPLRTSRRFMRLAPQLSKPDRADHISRTLALHKQAAESKNRARPNRVPLQYSHGCRRNRRAFSIAL